MRIPPSVIVMSLLTAVPFGLGIRDALSGKDRSIDEHGAIMLEAAPSERERQRELEEYEAALREEALQREAEQQERSARYARLTELVGPKVASMGPLLAGGELGAPIESVRSGAMAERIQRLRDGGVVDLSFETYTGAIDAVQAYVKTAIDDHVTCPAFWDKLEAAWGTPTNGVWRDPEKRQRMTLNVMGCWMRFERYVEPADWVAALPFDLVGASRDKLLQSLVEPNEEGDRVYWGALGVGVGDRATELWAHVNNDRVLGIEARVRTDADSAVAVREALVAKLSAQPEHDEANRSWTWKLRVPVMFEQLDNEIIVTIGKMP